MKFTRLLAVFCFAFCTFALALPVRAEMAGQVLDTVGDVFALRGGHIVQLHPGSAVESGDQIHTAAESHVQIRFTDWGQIALRSNSDFVVDEYSYESRKDGRQRAFFSLLKGGIRSLTGMIGHSNRKNFSLRVATATVGIRGTHFTVLMCQGECRNSDGSVALDGLYGEILEGRIAVSPYGGNDLEREFGAGEFFHLMSENSVPAPLFSLPPFFRDKLDDQARSAGSAVAGIAPAGKPTVGGTGSLVNVLSPTGSPATSGFSLPTTSPVASVGSTVNAVVAPVVSLVTSTVNTVTAPLVPLVASTVNAVVAPVMPLVTSTVSTVTAPVMPLVTSTVSTVTAPVMPLVNTVTTPVTPLVTTIAAPASLGPVGTPIGSVIGSTINLRATPPAITPPPPLGLPSILPLKK